MKKAGVSCFAILSLILMLTPSASLGQRTGDVPYTEATFEVSEEPTRVVMQVRTSGGLLAATRTMTVYGDGLVELQGREKDHVTGNFTVHIGIEGVRSLMETAVSHGVAEWHSDTIRAWMRQKHPRLLNIADGGRVGVSLALEHYRRGSYEKTNHSLSFTTKTPADAARFYPEIAQFQGVTELLKWFDAEWNKAKQAE